MINYNDENNCLSEEYYNSIDSEDIIIDTQEIRRTNNLIECNRCWLLSIFSGYIIGFIIGLIVIFTTLIHLKNITELIFLLLFVLFVVPLFFSLLGCYLYFKLCIGY